MFLASSGCLESCPVTAWAALCDIWLIFERECSVGLILNDFSWAPAIGIPWFTELLREMNCQRSDYNTRLGMKIIRDGTRTYLGLQHDIVRMVDRQHILAHDIFAALLKVSSF